MRLWFDAQALQGPFFERGIQRYVRAVTTELERRAAPVEAFGLNPSQRDVYPQHGSVATSPSLRPATAANLRAAARHEDLVYVCGSAFEGFSPIQNLWPNYTVIPEVPAAAIVYDTIPFRRPAQFQATRERRSFYAARGHLLRQADRFLAISHSSGAELSEDLDVDPSRIDVIGCGVDARFVPPDDLELAAAELAAALPDITFPFLLYVGGFQPQKNIEGLLEAYALLGADHRAAHQLVIGGSVTDEIRRRWEERSTRLGIADRVLFTGLVSDETLLRLYQCARLLVFPSLHEGFGLPVAEAAACGTPAISSNTSSLPEVIGWEPATFDPTLPDAIATAIERVLGDEAFSVELTAVCRAAAAKHRWPEVVDRMLAALEPLSRTPRSGSPAPRRVAVIGGAVPPIDGARVDVYGATPSITQGVLSEISFGRTAEPALYDEVLGQLS